MIASKFFRKQFVIAAGSVFLCVILGASLLSLIVQLTFPQKEIKIQTPSLFLNLVENEGKGDLLLGIKRAESLLGKDDPVRLFLLDEKGNPLYPSSAAVPRVERLPSIVHESIPINGKELGLPGLMPPLVTRLASDPPRYLLMEMTPLPGFGPSPPPGGRLFFPLSLLTMASMVLLGIGVALWIIFRSLRATAIQADEVISELKRGNLKARFPIQRNDEIGQAMQRFNSMADEIENLVERLRVAESSRNNLLQELTHDLRTPVASLRTMLEGVFQSVEMDGEVRELSELSMNEVEYLGRLVEDLLLLARLTEPRFKASKGFVDFLALLEQECEALSYKYDEKIEVVTHFHVDEALIQGDEHLFHRLVRNTIENAFTYASHRIEIDVFDAGQGAIQVKVRDDGPGFSPESLAKFGERREQRTVQKTKGGKLSLGLGSVIMKSVVSLHGGQIKASNGPGGGAVIEYTLPSGR